MSLVADWIRPGDVQTHRGKPPQSPVGPLSPGTQDPYALHASTDSHAGRAHVRLRLAGKDAELIGKPSSACLPQGGWTRPAGC